MRGTAGHWVISGYSRGDWKKRVVPEGLLLSDLSADMITLEDGRRGAVSCCDHGNSHQKWWSMERRRTVCGDECGVERRKKEMRRSVTRTEIV